MRIVVLKSSPDLRRITVHSGAVHIDLALPAAVPVTVLIPSIVDVLAGRDGSGDDSPAQPEAAHYQLCRLGGAALEPSTTLAQNDIQDGSVLVLSRSSFEPPAPRFDDVAEAVSMALNTLTPPWTRRASRLTAAISAVWLAAVGGLLLGGTVFAGPDARRIATAVATAACCVSLLAAAIAHRTYRDAMGGLTLGILVTGFAGVAGFLAVPGGPGAPNVLLGAMAAALAAVLAIRVTDSGTAILTTLSCLSIIAALAALVAVVTGAPLRTLGAIGTVISLGLIEAAARLSIASAGLSPRLSSTPDAADDIAGGGDRLTAQAIRADERLTSLIAAFSGTSALGAIVTTVGAQAVGGPHLAGGVFATLTGASLLLRARSEADHTRTMVLIISGIACISAAFVATAAAQPQWVPWIGAATVALAAPAFCLGFVMPAITFSPVSLRVAETAEYLTLVAIVPLACWTGGFYGAIRSLNLT